MNKITDLELQRWKQMHEIARHYDNQLRAIPVLTLTLLSVEMGALHTDNIVSVWNVMVAGIAMIVSGFFLLLFYKVHFQQLRISKQIKKHSDDLASFYTITTKDVLQEIEEMRDGRNPYKLHWFQRWIILQSAGKAVKTLTFLAILLNLVFIIYIIFLLYS
jgi:hypothetical protein